MESCRAVGAVSQAGEEAVGFERRTKGTLRRRWGGGWERPGWWRIGEGAEARVRRPSVIKARQELRRDERTAAPEDTARDLCDSDIQPASIAEPQKRFSAYRLVTSRPPTDIAEADLQTSLRR